jgi:hypothetical protein
MIALCMIVGQVVWLKISAVSTPIEVAQVGCILDQTIASRPPT